MKLVNLFSSWWFDHNIVDHYTAELNKISQEVETVAKIAIISDVHSNLESLNVVMDMIDALGISRIICLGDTVGYNADPGPCLEIVSKRCELVLMGNHDLAVVSPDEMRYFNDLAIAGVLYSSEQISMQQKAYLLQLSKVASYEEEGLTFAHGSLTGDNFFYILDRLEAFSNFKLMKEQFLFVGHSHQAFCCTMATGYNDILSGKYPYFQYLSYKESMRIDFEKDKLYIINPGSVGQPRDYKKPSFCVLDTDESAVVFYRYTYDLDSTVNKIIAAELPEAAWRRLEKGI